MFENTPFIEYIWETASVVDLDLCIVNDCGNISLKPWKFLVKYEGSLHLLKQTLVKNSLQQKFTLKTFSMFLYDANKIFHHFCNLEILPLEAVFDKLFLRMSAKFFWAAILQNSSKQLLFFLTSDKDRNIRPEGFC